MKILIIGGVAGGATVAARLRRLDEDARIILFERGQYISYANCGLPYYIGEDITERDEILIQTPESFTARFNIDVRVRHEVMRIDRAAKEVVVKDHVTAGEYRESYDRLVLSPGAEALVPPLPGIDCGRVFTLRSVPDADTIKTFVKEHKPRRAVVVGAGYIGLEMAENLHRLGIFVTLVEMAQQVIAPLDFEMAALVHQHLKTKNVEFYLGEQVASFAGCGEGVTVHLKSGRELVADLVILSIGIKPETRLAREAGLAIGESGGIAVDEFMRTSDHQIYAVGDAVEAFDPIFRKKRLVPLAGPANKQGRIAADNIVFGDREKYRGTTGTAVAKVFDITVGVTGFSEKYLRQQKMVFHSVLIHSVSHAGYYPGAMPLSLKLNVAEDGRIYGAQVVGYDGVDKATELFSLACGFGLSVRELKDMDQAYAPPYSSVRSPVNMISFVAENALRGIAKFKNWQDVRDCGENVFLLDVRTRAEVRIGAIPGSHNIPLDQLRGRLAEVPKDKTVYVYCASGLRSYIAARILMQHGCQDVYDISGGYKTWETATMHQGNEDIYEKYRVNKDDIVYQKEREGETMAPSTDTSIEIDARGLQCPGPIMRLNERMKDVSVGMTVKIRATDPGFINDVKSWCNVTGNTLLSLNQDIHDLFAVIRKSAPVPEKAGMATGGNNKTIIVFDDDFDRALAAFVIANGALAMGRKVTMFFTFWGLSILKKQKQPRVRKDFISRMFDLMLPRGTAGLKLSRLNMFGIGPKLMQSIMKRKNIDSLRVMMEKVRAGGAVLIACQMSMDIMGITKEELIDGIEYGGVATYIEATESASTNLFI